MPTIINDPKNLYATPIDTWESIIREIKSAKSKGNNFNAKKAIEEFQELCYSPYPYEDELTDWKKQQIASLVEECFQKNNRINNMLEILRVLKYLQVTSVSIDLFTVLETAAGISKSVKPFENEEKKSIITMNKIYTNGNFLLRPLIISKEGLIKEYGLDNLRSNSWEIITKNREEENNSFIDERVAVLHSLEVNPRKFPSKNELDSMEFPKLNVIFNGRSKGLPWNYQARYEETYPKVGFQYKKELK